MGFSFRVAPGLRVRVSSRGVRAGIGPRVARVHVGGGYRAGVSTGAGPFTAYHSVGGGSRRSSKAHSSSGARRPAPNAGGKTYYRAELQTYLQKICYLHRGSFPPSQPPVAPPAEDVNAREIERHHLREAAKGLSWFARRERARARQQAYAAAMDEIDAAKAEREEDRVRLQAELDAGWRSLVENDPEAVSSAMEEAFQGAGPAPLHIDGNSRTIVTRVPGLDAVPERAPGVTPTGRASLRKMSKTERNDLYGEVLCGHLLLEVRKTLAVAPGLQEVQACAVRAGQQVGTEGRVECLLSARFRRQDLANVRWDQTTSAAIVDVCAREVAVHRTGRAREFQPLDPTSDPVADQVAKRVRFNQDGNTLTVQFSFHKKVTRTPRNQAELAALLRQKPPGWEHLYFAGHLLYYRDATEPKYHVYLHGRAEPKEKAISLSEFDAFVAKALAVAKDIGDTMETVTSREAQRAAFGPPGHPVDSERIAGLAEHFNDIYEAFLDWVAAIRSVNAPAECRHALELLAKFGEDPVQEYRAFVDEVVSSMDKLPAVTAAGQPFKASFHLVFTGLPQEVVEDFRNERARLRALSREANPSSSSG